MSRSRGKGSLVSWGFAGAVLTGQGVYTFYLKTAVLPRDNPTAKRSDEAMAVFRVERNKGYTVMSNHHLRNKELTLKAKGLLSQMLSLPEDWDYTLAGLSHINREKIDAIREAVNPLRQSGKSQTLSSLPTTTLSFATRKRSITPLCSGYADRLSAFRPQAHSM